MGFSGDLSRYELLDLIARGGFGEVRRARHKVTRRHVAIKLLNERALGAGLRPEDLVRESQALAEVDHPNVVGVLDCGVEHGQAFLVMELLDGQTLSAVLQERGPLGPAEAVPLAMQLLLGLAAVHERGIVHCDVKPSNVMLDRRGLARLIDFGLSFAAARQDRALGDRGAGTPGYMAPEQYDARVQLDARVDVYGVGATLYRCLTGAVPFADLEPEERRTRLLTTAVPPIRTQVPLLPAHVGEAIDRALARDRDARHATATDFLRALEGVPQVAEASTLGSGLAAELVDGSSPAAPAAGRSAGRRVGGLVALCLGVALLSGGLLLLRRGQPQPAPALLVEASGAFDGSTGDDDDRPAPVAAPLARPPAPPKPEDPVPDVFDEGLVRSVVVPAGAGQRTFGLSSMNLQRRYGEPGARALFARALPLLSSCARLACLDGDGAALVSLIYAASASGQTRLESVDAVDPARAPCPALDACLREKARALRFSPARTPGVAQLGLMVVAQ